MSLNKSKEFEIYYPGAVAELRGNISPIIRGILAKLEKEIGSPIGAGMVLERYLSTEDANDYYRCFDPEYDIWLPADYRAEYISLAQEIIGRTVEYLPASLPTDRKAIYARSIALTLCIDMVREMLPQRLNLFLQRKYPQIHWQNILMQREN